MKHLFTSEAVTEGHPDKLCDRISDAVLDAMLRKDQASRVACETFATTGLVVVGGDLHRLLCGHPQTGPGDHLRGGLRPPGGRL